MSLLARNFEKMGKTKWALISVLFCCSITKVLAEYGDIRNNFQNLGFQTEEVKNSIRPSLMRSIDPLKQNKKMEALMDRKTMDQLEASIIRFKLESSIRNKRSTLPAIQQLSDIIEEKGGVDQLVVTEMMEWFMKSVMDLLVAIDYSNKPDVAQQWPTYQILKQLFVDIVKPIEKLVIDLFPLPPYKTMSLMRDGNKGGMRYVDEVFDNWAGTLSANSTVRTFFPRSVAGIQEIIRLAGKEGAKVRASGIRHTTTPWLWGTDGDIQPQPGHNLEYVIAMVPQEVSDHLAYARDSEGWEKETDLAFVEGPLNVWEENGKKVASVRMGAATLNSHYADWGKANGWTMPANTIQHLMTIGGVATPMCHGGGLKHKTIADRIIKIEYVDSEGELQYVDDPVLLRSAAGSLGLLGIVTAITYKFDEMSYARFWPRHWNTSIDEFLNFGGEVPEETIALMNNSYYFEMIQFSEHHNANGILFVNAWDNLGRSEDAVDLINDLEEEYSEAYMLLSELANKVFRLIQKATDNGDYLYWVFGWMSGFETNSAMLDFDEPVTTTTLEAMHFQRGLHYVSTNLAEINIPIPPTADGQPNWTIVQQSWKDMMELTREFNAAGKYPVDLGLESRLMAGSDLLLAPQYGNYWTQSIEISGSPLVPREVWEEFKVNCTWWANYVGPLTGKKLNVRPHWAKEFPDQVNDDDFKSFAKKAFGNQLPDFFSSLKEVVASNNGDFLHSMNMFSTKYLDILFEEYYT